MNTFFDITSDDIAKLDDGTLRELIGRLCEADLRSAGQSTKGVLYGGNQDEPDGGLDVVVRNEVNPPQDSHIPRANTGFQVKKPSMSAGALSTEMRPDGTVRPSIQELVATSGAYIVVSSGDSLTDLTYKRRLTAMREAVADVDLHSQLFLDFYDANKVATWVRSHSSVVLWVREKTGRPIQGWKPYDNWANSPGGLEEEYVVDEELRFYDSGTTTSENYNGKSVLDGIADLRSALNRGGTSVRLVGLSGVGKTRLVQALFDDRVGENSLSPHLAVYTDISFDPSPPPVTVAESLKADNSRAVLVVDNCPKNLHRQLTQVCTNSSISLLTVEYDIQDDLPEETAVFRLEPSSEKVIETLIDKRFPHISEVDARTIATFSGGNARLAIALANTVGKGDTISGFQDEQLFERLFWQRGTLNTGLLHSAEVCSLVYSFQGEEIADDSELAFLALLIGTKPMDLYRDVAELHARGLVQSRGVWRAVLPHAVANRLATKALRSIPRKSVSTAFRESASERLVLSFTRRLSYLHTSDDAVAIASEWLQPGGWLGSSVSNFNAFGMDLFLNLAPVVPELTLTLIEQATSGADGERFISKDNSNRSEFARILYHLAYDAALFGRSARILVQLALIDDPANNSGSGRNVLKSLFHVILSGTKATASERATVVHELIESGDERKQQLALQLLEAALETYFFTSSFELSFGARSRDYGYWPRTQTEFVQWFNEYIGITTELALSQHLVAYEARILLAKKVRGLWNNGHAFDAVYSAARKLHEQMPWTEGWLAVRSTMRHDKKAMDDAVTKKLHDLEQFLRPKNLAEQARAYALVGHHNTLDLDDDYEEGEDRVEHAAKMEKAARELGVEVAKDPVVLQELLPEMVSTYSSRLSSFAMGLAEGSSDIPQLWRMMYTELVQTLPNKRNFTAILGFLSGCAQIAPEFFDEVLDSITSDSLLGAWYPIFQINTSLNQQGFSRLLYSIDQGVAPIQNYVGLAHGRRHEAVEDSDLIAILHKILSKEGGLPVVIEILQMRFHSLKQEGKHSEGLIEIGREVLANFPFTSRDDSLPTHSYSLAQIAAVCIAEPEAEGVARAVCRNLAAALLDDQVYTSDSSDFLKTLAQMWPICFLDEFLQGTQRRRRIFGRLFSEDLERDRNPLSEIPDEIIIAWCDQDPEMRYPTVIREIQTFAKSGEEGVLIWRTIVYEVIERTQQLDAVLEQLGRVSSLMSWSGSKVVILQERSTLYQSLFEHHKEEVRAWARKQHQALHEEIEREQDWEKNNHREFNERFEW